MYIYIYVQTINIYLYHILYIIHIFCVFRYMLILNRSTIAVVGQPREVGGEHTAQCHRLPDGLHHPERSAVLWRVAGRWMSFPFFEVQVDMMCG